MSSRLECICSLIERTHSFIDVGCDHGYAVKYVADNSLAERITACDVSRPSLEKAKKLIGDDPRIAYVCADGAVAAMAHDTVLIAGMGGMETVHILAHIEPRVVILSPQSHVREVRELLLRKRYAVVYDKVIKDKNKYYDVIKAVKSDAEYAADEMRLEFGMFYDKEGNETLYELLDKKLAALASYPPTAENVRRAHVIKEVLRCRLR